MRLKYLQFFPITFFSVFLIGFPSLAQSASYTATINRFEGDQVGQTIRVSTPEQLVERVYKTIRPPGNLRSPINIPLGTLSLSTLQNNLQSRGVSAQYFIVNQRSIFTGKDPSEPLNVSSIRSLTATYIVSLSRGGYETTSAPFRVTKIRNGNPLLRFENSSISLVDKTRISYAVDPGNSDISPNRFEQYLRRDSRLYMFSQQEVEACRRRSLTANQVGPGPCPNYSIRLSRD